jgi:hypothetical protein
VKSQNLSKTWDVFEITLVSKVASSNLPPDTNAFAARFNNTTYGKFASDYKDQKYLLAAGCEITVLTP